MKPDTDSQGQLVGVGIEPRRTRSLPAGGAMRGSAGKPVILRNEAMPGFRRSLLATTIPVGGHRQQDHQEGAQV